jgi:hypothetical protein
VVGGSPTISEKVRLKVPRLANPTSKQISVTLRSVSLSRKNRPLYPPALEVPMRRLAERGAEDADEVELGDEGDPRQRRNVKRLRVVAIHRVTRAARAGSTLQQLWSSQHLHRSEHGTDFAPRPVY